MTLKKSSLIITLRGTTDSGKRRTFSKLRDDVSDTEIHNLGKALGRLFEASVSNFQRKDIEEIV